MSPALKESETREFKKSTSQLEKAVISMVAMLNKHQRGEVFFGIDLDGIVVGELITEKKMRTISQKIAKIEPTVYPRIDPVIIDGKNCIHIEVEGDEIPYSVGGKFYIRVADEDLRLSGKEIRNIILKRFGDDIRWDSIVSEKTIEHINEEAVMEFMKKGRRAGRIDFDFEDVRTTLEKLGLMKNGHLLKAAEVLFCDENDFEVQMAIFAGTDKNNFLDIDLQKGNLFHLLHLSELYIKKNIRWRVRFTGSMERDEIPELPLNSLREALINSLCHRDFRVPKGNEVAIFKNRVEIYNPGDFPEGYTPEDFITGKERSVLRNKLIAEAFYRTKDIEKWGSGLKRIHDECESEGVQVRFEILKSGFLTTFYRQPGEVGVTDHPVEEEQDEETLSHQHVSWSDLSEKQLRILLLLKEYPKTSRKELSGILGINPSAVQKHIEKLKKRGLLRHSGPSKGGRWEVVEK